MHQHTLPDYRDINENFNPAPYEGETFLPVPGYPGYEVSDYGRVISHMRGGPRVLKVATLRSGHLKVTICRGGKKKQTTVHRLVAQAHLGPAPTDKPYVLHANDIPADNRLANIRYGDNSDNQSDRVLNGRDHKANRTHCPRGHAYVHANTYIGHGRRYCIACQRGRAMKKSDFHEHAHDIYTALTTAPGADLTPVLSATLAAEVVG